MHPRGSFEHRILGYRRIAQACHPPALAQRVMCAKQNVDAVTGNGADDESPQGADHEPGEFEGVWHRQNSRSHRTFQQMHERIEISVHDWEKCYVRCHVTFKRSDEIAYD